MPGSMLHLDLVDAQPHSDAVLVIGDSADYLPILGGTLVPGGQLFLVPGRTNGQGQIRWSTNAWSLLPPGSPLYFQVGIVDAGAPFGLALSNALTFTTP